MQEVRYSDGRVEQKLIQASTDEELKDNLKREYELAMANGAEEIKQAIVNPASRCLCGSGKLMKNCCLKR